LKIGKDVLGSLQHPIWKLLV